jgi:hypothetical protein
MTSDGRAGLNPGVSARIASSNVRSEYSIRAHSGSAGGSTPFVGLLIWRGVSTSKLSEKVLLKLSTEQMRVDGGVGMT